MKKVLLCFLFLLAYLFTETKSANIYVLNPLNLDGGHRLNTILASLNHNVIYSNTLPSTDNLNGIDIFVGLNGNLYYAQPGMGIESEIAFSDTICPAYDNGQIHILLFGNWNVTALLERCNVAIDNTMPIEPATQILGTTWWMGGKSIGYNEDPFSTTSISTRDLFRVKPGYNLAKTNVGPQALVLPSKLTSTRKKLTITYGICPCVLMKKILLLNL